MEYEVGDVVQNLSQIAVEQRHNAGYPTTEAGHVHDNKIAGRVLQVVGRLHHPPIGMNGAGQTKGGLHAESKGAMTALGATRAGAAEDARTADVVVRVFQQKALALLVHTTPGKEAG